MSYVGAFAGVCPDCKSSVIGHMTENEARDVYVWHCPACQAGSVPEGVERLTPVFAEDHLK